MKKRIYRDSKNSMLAGVCAGIAKYFDLDPTIVRILWVVVTLAGGSGLIAYIICALIIPDEPEYNEVNWTDIDDDKK